MSIRSRLLQEFFFSAAMNTYAAKKKPSTLPELPGSKVYEFESPAFPGLRYVDIYYSGNDGQSGGQTIIFINIDEDWQPAWLMHYDGFEIDPSDKGPINCLKSALIEAYEAHEFYGGRGRPIHVFTDLVGYGQEERSMNYENHSEGDFEEFNGEESVKVGESIMFFHRYSGRLLLKEI